MVRGAVLLLLTRLRVFFLFYSSPLISMGKVLIELNTFSLLLTGDDPGSSSLFLLESYFFSLLPPPPPHCRVSVQWRKYLWTENLLKLGGDSYPAIFAGSLTSKSLPFFTRETEPLLFHEFEVAPNAFSLLLTLESRLPMPSHPSRLLLCLPLCIAQTSSSPSLYVHSLEINFPGSDSSDFTLLGHGYRSHI